METKEMETGRGQRSDASFDNLLTYYYRSVFFVAHDNSCGSKASLTSKLTLANVFVNHKSKPHQRDHIAGCTRIELVFPDRQSGAFPDG